MKEDWYSLAPLIKMINESIEKKMNHELKHYGITCSQLRVLMLLYQSDEGVYSLKELEKQFHISQQAVAGIVKRLESKRLVVGFTDTEDKRIKKIRLTEKGRKLGNDAKHKMNEYENNVSNCLNREEQKQLTGLLKKVCAFVV